MICARCGSDSENWPMGAWPFCKGDPTDHAPAHVAIVDDALEGGPRFFAMDHQPVWCETKTQLQQELDKRNLRIFDDRAFEGDRHVTNARAYIDAKTLDDKRVLLSRGTRHTDDSMRCETFHGSVRELKSLSEAS